MFENPEHEPERSGTERTSEEDPHGRGGVSGQDGEGGGAAAATPGIGEDGEPGQTAVPAPADDTGGAEG
jgi:hypothetical protein